MNRAGHTLVEVLTVVLVLSILACVAVPRLNWGGVWGAQAEGAVRRLATDLRRARSHAILEAAQNQAGFALVMRGSAPYKSYQIISLLDLQVLENAELPGGVVCQGGTQYAFGPLGNLSEGSDTNLYVSAQDRSYLLEIVPGTGAVTWTRCD